jgi:hypothetical protein
MWPSVNGTNQSGEATLRKIRKGLLDSVYKTITPRMPLVEYLRYLKLKREF